MLLFITFSLSSFAQNSADAEIWTSPAAFLPDEEVTWYFDVSGTSLEDIHLDDDDEGIYLWTWFPSEPDAGNFENSSEFAALTHVEGNIWRIDLTPTTYYGVSADQISAFYGKLKNKDGTLPGDDTYFAPDMSPPNPIMTYDLSTIQDEGITEYFSRDNQMNIEPLRINRPLSIMINANNTWSEVDGSCIQGDLANAANVHIHAGLNNWDQEVEITETDKTLLTDLGNGVYRMDMIISDYFNLTENDLVNSFHFVFESEDGSYIGNDAGCEEFVIEFEHITPTLTIFPQKVSQKDILSLIRTDNEAGISNLYYTIQAGDNTIDGEFSGSSAEMSAYINLVEEMKEMTGLENLNVMTVTIRDNNANTIAEQEVAFEKVP